jgi:hypothetical protein
MFMVTVAFFLVSIDSVFPSGNLSRNSNTDTYSNQLKRDLQILLRDDSNAGIQTIFCLFTLFGNLMIILCSSVNSFTDIHSVLCVHDTY